MLHKVIGIIRNANHNSTLQSYYNSLRQGRETSGPTYDEARKDFKAYESTRYQAFGKII